MEIRRTQPRCFVDHTTRELRIGYYNDTYLRTPGGCEPGP
jgi:hypothetical protein